MIWTHGMINRLVMLCDGLMILAGVLVSHSLTNNGHDLLSQFVYAVIFTIIYGWVMNIGGSFRVEYYSSILRQVRQVTVVIVLTGLVMSLINSAITLSNMETALAEAGRVAAIWIAILIGRFTLVKLGMYWVQKLKLLRRTAVIVGNAANAELAMQMFSVQHRRPFELLGVFLMTPDMPSGVSMDATTAQITAMEGQFIDVPMLGGPTDLLNHLSNTPTDIVIVALPWSDAPLIGSIVEKLSSFSVDLFVPLERDVFDPFFARITDIAGLRTLQVLRQPLRGSHALLKWLEDYIVASIALVLVSPILLISAIIIKLESPGPIFYRQKRSGYNNRLFDVFKLRTMTVDLADDGSRGTQRDSPRITRSGKWLRRLSIDELPQLFNVLRGEMSVVGPRPHVPNMLVGEDVRYNELRAYLHRYRVKPGITGWAQIHGMRGGIHTTSKAIKGIKLDLYYVENLSLWLDIKIMLLTLTKGMAGHDVF